MFKHILIPTDGSRLAAKGIKAGVKLAKSLGARVTGVYVAAPYMPPIYGEAGVSLTGLSQKEYDKIVAEKTKKGYEEVENTDDED